jgi:hypothetical protein
LCSIVVSETLSNSIIIDGSKREKKRKERRKRNIALGSPFTVLCDEVQSSPKQAKTLFLNKKGSSLL